MESEDEEDTVDKGIEDVSGCGGGLGGSGDGVWSVGGGDRDNDVTGDDGGTDDLDSIGSAQGPGLPLVGRMCGTEGVLCNSLITTDGNIRCYGWHSINTVRVCDMVTVGGCRYPAGSLVRVCMHKQ